jgi:hypothetical protein
MVVARLTVSSAGAAAAGNGPDDVVGAGMPACDAGMAGGGGVAPAVIPGAARPAAGAWAGKD